MNPSFILIVITIFSLIPGIGLITRRPKNPPGFYLGIFILLVAGANIHLAGINIFFETPYNPLILIPLNVIFLPAYFIGKHYNSLLHYDIIPKYLLKTIWFIGLSELLINLLPAGAWIYTNKFDRNLIAFLFLFKRIYLFLLIPFTIAILWFLFSGFKREIKSIQQDFEKSKWVRETMAILMVIIIVVLLPEIALNMGTRTLSLYFIQAVVTSFGISMLGFRYFWLIRKIGFGANTNSKPDRDETNLKFKSIKQLMENEKLFRNPELRVNDIAERVFLSPNYVSSIINENANMGFNDYVNRYRVEEIIERFKNGEHQKKNIYSLAQDSGFKSKSTFQSAFKKQTGKTPSEMLHELITKP